MAAPAVTERKSFGGRVRRIRVTQSGENDANIDFEAPRPLLSITAQLRGTYTSGSVTFQGSNDNSTFAALPTATAFSALGLKSVAVADLGYLYYRAAFATMHADNDLVLDIIIKEAP